MAGFATNNIWEMAPWEIIPYFAPPKVTVKNPINPGDTAAAADNRRAILVFTAASGTFSCVQSDTNGLGFPVVAQNPALMFTTFQHGPLPTYQWFFSGGGVGSCKVWEFSVIDWPKPGRDPLANILHPPPPPPPRTVLPTAPGVGGGRGLVDWLAARIAQLTKKS